MDLVGTSNRGKPNEVALRRVYREYKKAALSRKMEFTLTENELDDIIHQNCYYCGSLPSNSFPLYRTKDSPVFYYSGIDRVDNTIGYVKSNVVPCCSICNFAKSNLTLEQFTKWAKQLYFGLYKKITNKTPGELIDTLITIDIKCFMEQEKLCNRTDSTDIAEAAKKAQELNAKRNKVMRSIDALLDFDEDMVTDKTYGEK